MYENWFVIAFRKDRFFIISVLVIFDINHYTKDFIHYHLLASLFYYDAPYFIKASIVLKSNKILCQSKVYFLLFFFKYKNYNNNLNCDYKLDLIKVTLKTFEILILSIMNLEV